VTTHQDVKDATAQTEATMKPQSVPVNMYTTSEAVVVVAPLPAVQPEDVCVEVRDGNLRFWSHVRSAGTRSYLLLVWVSGVYARVRELPRGCGAGVAATLANGQLAVRVLKGAPTGETVSVTPSQP
jgi:HSP20 family molecular chaperone IbpA